MKLPKIPHFRRLFFVLGCISVMLLSGCLPPVEPVEEIFLGEGVVEWEPSNHSVCREKARTVAIKAAVHAACEEAVEKMNKENDPELTCKYKTQNSNAIASEPSYDFYWWPLEDVPGTIKYALRIKRNYACGPESEIELGSIGPVDPEKNVQFCGNDFIKEIEEEILEAAGCEEPVVTPDTPFCPDLPPPTPDTPMSPDLPLPETPMTPQAPCVCRESYSFTIPRTHVADIAPFLIGGPELCKPKKSGE